ELSVKLCKYVSAFLLYSTIIASLIGVLFSYDIANLCAYGFADAETKRLSGEYLKLMFPILIFLSLGALCMGVLNFFQRFFITSFAPTILNVSLIAAVLYFSRKFGVSDGEKMFALCYGTLFGAVLYLIFLAYPYFKAGFKFGLRFKFGYAPFVKTLKLMIPGIPGQALYELNFMANRFIASFLGAGSISYLYYANRLYQFPLALFGIGVSLVLLPSAASAVSESNTEKLLNHYYDSFKFMCYFIIPVAFFSIILDKEIIELVYQRDGTFTYKTAAAFKYYIVGLAAYAGANITSQMYFSMKDTLSPVKYSAINMIINLALNIIIVLIWTNENTRFAGLSLSNSLSGFVYLAIIIYNLKKRIPELNYSFLFSYILKISGIAAVSCVVLYIVYLNSHFTFENRIIERVLNFSLPAFSGITAYFILTTIFKVELSEKLWYNINRKIFGLNKN
ncbi:MAG TPA: lipid II flippase MurJ, partial [bacterium]|nr:lipid II flippase MurJ [bacterium]